MTESSLAFLLKLFDVAYESRITVYFKFVLLLCLLKLLFPTIYLLVDHLVYLSNVSRSFLTILHALIELVSKFCSDLDDTRVQKVNISLIYNLKLASVLTSRHPTLLGPLRWLDTQGLSRHLFLLLFQKQV